MHSGWMNVWVGVEEVATLNERKKKERKGKGKGAVFIERLRIPQWFRTRALAADHQVQILPLPLPNTVALWNVLNFSRPLS